MNALTEFGDSAVLLPLAGILFLWLLSLPNKGVAVWWVAALAICIGGTALLKIYFYGCPHDARLHNPSGHVSLSTLVYGGFATVIVARSVYWKQMAIFGGAIALVTGIAVSRIVLNAHTALEVGLGLIIGFLSLALFVSRYLRQPADNPRFGIFVFAALFVIIVTHGDTLRAERLFHRIGAYAQLEPIVCS